MRQNQFSPMHTVMKWLCTALGLVLAVLLCATAYFHHMLSQINVIPGGNPVNLVPEAIGAFLPSQESGTSVIQKKDLINILLIGQDRREQEDTARSDSMILCSFNKETKTLTMTSFLRDLYVPIPGHGSNRINAAYAFGGMELLEETLEENFGLAIDGSVEVDFSQFASIIDLLGGVELELRQDEANVINRETGSSLSEGVHLLSGQQALVYSRIRKLDMDGDFSRTNRQRKVMGALLDAYKNASIPTMLLLLDEILPMITTDIRTGRIVTMAMEVLPALSDATIVSQHVPAEGTYTDQVINGMSVLVADREEIRKMLQQSLMS